MKKLLLSLFALIQISLWAQDNFVYTNYINGSKEHHSGYASLVSTFGKENVFLYGGTIKIENHKGNPLLLNDWAKAEVLFTDGNTYLMPLMNYDVLSDQFILYLKGVKKSQKGLFDKDLPIISLSSDQIISVSLKNEKTQKKFIKISKEHFSSEPKTRFFEYFSDSPKDAYLVRSYTKRILHNKMIDMPYSDTSEEYAITDYYQDYIKNKNDVFVPVKLKKKSVLRGIGDAQAEKSLKEYIKKHKLNMSKPEDVQKLLAYYHNELKSK